MFVSGFCSLLVLVILEIIAIILLLGQRVLNLYKGDKKARHKEYAQPK